MAEIMMMEKYVTVTKYSFSMDGEQFARGYLVTDDDNRGGRLFRMGTLYYEKESPVEENVMLDARMDNEAADVKLLLRKDRFMFSLRDRKAYHLPSANENVVKIG
jgi:hypothetical protein